MKQELNNREAEEQVIAHLLQEEENAAKAFLDGLQPAMFSIPQYTIVSEAVYRFLHDGQPWHIEGIHTECIKVARECKKTAPPLSMLVSLATKQTHASSAFLHIVKSWHMLRGAEELARWVLDTVVAAPDPAQLIGELNSRLDDIRGGVRQNTSIINGREATREHLAELDNMMQRHREGLITEYPWPWHSWELNVAPLFPGFVGQVIADTKTGKSSYLENIAEGWAGEGLQVGFVHAENQRNYTLCRRDARLTGLDFISVMYGRLSNEERKMLGDTLRQNPWTDRITYIYGAGDDMETVVGKMKTATKEYGVQCWVLDYFNKIQFNRRLDKLSSMEPKEAHNAEVLKTFAADNDIPVMTAAQMNKESHGSRTKRSVGQRGSGQVREKFQLNITLDRPLLTASEAKALNSFSGKLGHTVNEGTMSPLFTVRVDSQNVGSDATFKQLYIGPRFTIIDPPGGLT